MLIFALMGPETAVLLALVVFAVTFRGSVKARRSPAAGRIAVWAAALVLGAYLLANLVPLLELIARYFIRALLPLFPEPWDVRWWVYVVPLAGAIVGLVIARASLRQAKPEVPVVPLVRRTWTSFAAKRDLVLASLSSGVLALTCVLAGIASSPGPTGWFAVILTPGGDGALSAGMTTFFGWAFGAPTLAALVVLALATYLVLRANAARPYLRPETVDAETVDRRFVSAAVLRVCGGAALLVLGSAWMMIGRAGISGTGLEILGSDAVVYPTGYSSFATTFIALGWFAQVFAFVMLLLTASGRRLSLPRRRAAVATAS